MITLQFLQIPVLQKRSFLLCQSQREDLHLLYNSATSTEVESVSRRFSELKFHLPGAFVGVNVTLGGLDIKALVIHTCTQDRDL